MQDTDKELLVRTNESTKQAHKRIDKLEATVENIYDLTTSIKEIAVEMKAMREDVTDMNIRLKQVEEKPGKRWDGAITTIIGTIAGALTGGIVALIIK